MGALIQGFGGTAAGAANAGLQWGNVGVGASALSPLLQGVGAFQMDRYSAAVASNNAAILRQNAGYDIAAGQYEESASKLRTGELVSAQKAAQGANNIDVNVGSPVAVRQSTRDIGAMDAAMIHFNAAKAAYGEQVLAGAEDARAAMLKRAAGGALFGGIFGAGTTLLSGASSLAGKAAALRLAFPANTAGTNSSAPSSDSMNTDTTKWPF